MRQLAFRILNVFAETPLGGNPLCVFEDGGGLDAATMQALALQFNLSETTFVLPAARGSAARVRIFTPTFEMPFAGHPTLGTAHVVRDLRGAGDAFALELEAGIIPVRAEGDRWTLEAREPRREAVELSRAEIAAALALDAAEVLDGAAWIDTGSNQLVVPLATTAAVVRAAPSFDGLSRLAGSGPRRLAYVFAFETPDRVRARFFFNRHTAVVEDPATGSACANLGGWLVSSGRRDLTLTILQGEAVGRPSELRLAIDAEGRIYVSGRVIELGRGTIALGEDRAEVTA